MEALSSGTTTNKNGWLGFNRFLESNIRATGDADLSGSAKMPVSAESADKKGEQKGPRILRYSLEKDVFRNPPAFE